MAHRTAKVVGAVAGALVLVGTGAALARGSDSDETLNPAAEAVADLPTVSDWTLHPAKDGCVFDEKRGGLVIEGLTVRSRSTGRLKLSAYVQRDSLDDILPGYVSTILTFDEDTRSHTFDLVVPVSRKDYEAGYDDCYWNAGGS